MSPEGVLQGMMAYRLRLGGVPASLALGDRTLHLTVEPNARMEITTTRNGPFAGLTGYG